MKRDSIWNQDIALLLGFAPTKKIKRRDLAVFCRKLSFMLDAGVTTETALSVLQTQTEKPAALRIAVTNIRSGIMRGLSLSHAMTETGSFPSFLSAMCRVGEMTARLPLIMARLADFYEGQARAEEELISALLYPAMVTVMMVSVMVLAVVFVLPGYTRVFSATGVTLPTPTRLLMAFSAALTEHIWLILSAVLGLVVVALLFFRSKPGKNCAAHIGLHAPIIGVVYRQVIELRFIQAMSLLLASGRPLSEAVPVCADVTGSALTRRDILRLSARLAEGKAFWEALTEMPYLDPLLSGMARIGEETGRLPQTMDKCREYFEQTHAATVRRINKLVEPAITVVLGVLLGFVMLSVILPTFALTNIY